MKIASLHSPKNLPHLKHAKPFLTGQTFLSYAPEHCEKHRETFRAKHNLPEETVTITFLARLDEAKQPMILPKIAAALKAKATNRPWKLVIAGDGTYQDALVHEIAKQGLGDVVQVIGWQPLPVEVLHGSDVILLPSLWEGLPRTLIEAHAAGLPCVASDARGNREVVHPETGSLVATHDVRRLRDRAAIAYREPLFKKAAEPCRKKACCRPFRHR